MVLTSYFWKCDTQNTLLVSEEYSWTFPMLPGIPCILRVSYLIVLPALSGGQPAVLSSNGRCFACLALLLSAGVP